MMLGIFYVKFDDHIVFFSEIFFLNKAYDVKNYCFASHQMTTRNIYDVINNRLILICKTVPSSILIGNREIGHDRNNINCVFILFSNFLYVL
jgi:hypothetical protein